jgi:hypothetical protein
VMTDEDLERLTDRFFGDIEAILKRHNDQRGTEFAMVSKVYSALAERLGEDAAEKLFAAYGPKPKSYESKERQHEFVAMYIAAGRPSVTDFARYAAEWNKGRPASDRLGCGTDNWVNMREYLKSQLRKKKYRDIKFQYYITPAGWDPPRRKVEEHLKK